VLSSRAAPARSFDRVLKLTRTIADLAHLETIGSNQVAEALQYRPRPRAERTLALQGKEDDGAKESAAEAADIRNALQGIGRRCSFA
jgi:hypothetical protein